MVILYPFERWLPLHFPKPYYLGYGFLLRMGLIKKSIFSQGSFSRDKQKLKYIYLKIKCYSNIRYAGKPSPCPD
jgi:hypothetical protein